MHPVVVRLLFRPTLAYNVLLSSVLPQRRWWDRVDDHVILGALPFRHQVERLASEGVAGVVNTCAEYAGPSAAYEMCGITQLRVPTLDFSPPSLEHVRRAVAFIDEYRAQDRTVYVHCKAGRGRSATVALCWLIHAAGLAPEEAQARLEVVRPHVNRSLWQRDVVRAFAHDARSA